MAIDPTELETLRDALIRARAAATRVVMMDGRRVEYGTDAEMANAIADLESRIRRASTPRPGSISFATSKGV
ncbi:phage head-tail joining protein [Rhodobacter lacus]|uniref:Phage head-tail joining protein n=1 Tax=Rhodobacter lacus TaxID=1641972 RepID=A0ABW5A753_9RHOB